MASGVKVADRVKDLFKQMKVVQKDDDEQERIRLVILEIRDGFIDVEKDKLFREKDLANEKDVYAFFLQQLKMDQCRYILYDCHFETKETCKKEELVLVMWAPDTASIKDKMNYAASKTSIKKITDGVKHEIQANDRSDCHDISQFAEKLGKSVLKIEGNPVHK